MQLDSNKEWLEGVAQRLTGRRIQVTLRAGAGGCHAVGKAARQGRGAGAQAGFERRGRSSPGIQAMLDVFPAEIRDVEEM